MNYEALQDIEILFGLALVTVVLFRRLMFPSIIGFLVTGILAGPYALAFIKDTHQVEQMAEIGVVLLLFTIGIELSLKELMRIKHLVLWGGGLQVLITILAVAAVSMAFGYSGRQILTIIFIGLGTAWLTAMAGLSLALGAFIAGLAISESDYSHQALGDIIPFREAFMSLFFISVGMLLDPAIVVRFPLLIASLVLTILLIKTLVTTAAAMVMGVPMRIAVIAALSLAQIGEFSFVLSQAGVKFGLLTPDLYQIFLAASILTMGLTPLCLKYAG